MGYTSTSLDIRVAKKFANFDLKDDEMPVIYEISFHGQKGLFQLTSEFTAFPGEEEVLVQDGLKYLITQNTKIKCESTGQIFCLVRLK